MSEITKHVAEFVAALNTLLEKGGGEAARLWPLLIQHYLARACVLFVSSMIVALCLFLAARTTYKKIDWLDHGSGFIPGTIVLTLFGVLLLFISFTLIPDVLYPEAGYVRTILGK